MIAAVRVESGKLPRWVVWSGWVLAAWATFAVLLVLQLLPDTSKTTRGGVLLLVLGPPAYAVLEWGSSRLFSAKTGVRISSARFSFARILVALLVALVALAPFAWWYLRRAS